MCDNKPAVDRAMMKKKQFIIPLGSLKNDVHAKVEFIPVNQNTVADCLSRLNAPKIYAVDEKGVTGKEIYLDMLKLKQKEDVAIHNIARQIYRGIPLHIMEEFEFENIKDNLHFVNGIVMVRDGDKDLVLIPNKDSL